MTVAALDLFGWRDLQAAEAAVAAAHAEQARAARNVRLAPMGQKTSRRLALANATLNALRAELQLAAVRREVGE